MIIAAVIVIILGLLAAFQIALALGAPWGRLAWGGADRVLPAGRRVASLVAVLLYAAFAVIVLAAAGLIDLPPLLVEIGIWVVFAVFVLGILANAASKSRRERALMTPLNAVLAALTLLVALGA
ncbi:hypothetical protein [Leifsonia sp. NPDC077715]|uniref:hypothetical protein n=1 Tax=Leifsonia sp. NPDC077715 TaxID=3155539 RepID=UPI00341CDA30